MVSAPAAAVLERPGLHRDVISDSQLRAAFVEPAMFEYFQRKLPDLDESELGVRIGETLKFLFIADECAGSIPVSREIDDVWHLWILQTQEYASLCTSLPTGEFIHHCSNDYLAYFNPAVGTDEGMYNDVHMLATYVANFGPFTAQVVRYWRLAAHLTERLGWTIEELNDWLHPGWRWPSAEAHSVAPHVDRHPPSVAARGLRPVPRLARS